VRLLEVDEEGKLQKRENEKRRRVKMQEDIMQERARRPLDPLRKMQIVIRAARLQSQPKMHEQKTKTPASDTICFQDDGIT
jgi:hypothetical protein